jgi:Trk-type K+ transport system membrane component
MPTPPPAVTGAAAPGPLNDSSRAAPANTSPPPPPPPPPPPLHWPRPTYWRLHVAYFAALITCGTFALYGIEAARPGGHLPFVDALFTAASAACVTGLITVDTATLSVASWCVLIVLMLAGSTTLLSATVPALRRHYMWRAARHAVSDPAAALAHSDEWAALSLMTTLALVYPALVMVPTFLIVGAVAATNTDGAGAPLAAIPGPTGSNPWFFALFASVSAFCNAGFALHPLNMIPWAAAPGVLLPMSFAVMAGNVGYPLALRGLLAALHAVTRGRLRGARYALSKPRRVFTHLFRPGPTRVLAYVLVAMLVTEIAFFLGLDWDAPALGGATSGTKVLTGYFQGVSTRTAGFNAVDLAGVATGMQFLYAVLMYVASYPVVLSMRTTAVALRKPTTAGGGGGGDDDDDEDGDGGGGPAAAADAAAGGRPSYRATIRAVAPPGLGDGSYGAAGDGGGGAGAMPPRLPTAWRVRSTAALPQTSMRPLTGSPRFQLQQQPPSTSSLPQPFVLESRRDRGGSGAFPSASAAFGAPLPPLVEEDAPRRRAAAPLASAAAAATADHHRPFPARRDALDSVHSREGLTYLNEGSFAHSGPGSGGAPSSAAGGGGGGGGAGASSAPPPSSGDGAGDDAGGWNRHPPRADSSASSSLFDCTHESVLTVSAGHLGDGELLGADGLPLAPAADGGDGGGGGLVTGPGGAGSLLPPPSPEAALRTHLRSLLAREIPLLLAAVFAIACAERGALAPPVVGPPLTPGGPATLASSSGGPSYSLWAVIFEVASAVGTVGLSLGYPGTVTSLSAQFSTFSKLVVIAVMLLGRHRGVPADLDASVRLVEPDDAPPLRLPSRVLRAVAATRATVGGVLGTVGSLVSMGGGGGGNSSSRRPGVPAAFAAATAAAAAAAIGPLKPPARPPPVVAQPVAGGSGGGGGGGGGGSDGASVATGTGDGAFTLDPPGGLLYERRGDLEGRAWRA